MLRVAHTWSLTAIAAVAGVALRWVWNRFSNRERMALAKRQTRAQLYAMRLYADDPARIFRAQGRLVVWTARYLAGMARPMAVAMVPLFLLCLQLDNIYGHRPPAAGESAVVTARFGGDLDIGTMAATLEGRGIAVETPAVRIPGRRQVCWRVRATTSAPGSVLLRMPGAAIVKAVTCGPSLGSPSIEVSCPAATLDVFGFGIDWAAWFLVVSGIAMLVTRSR